MEDSVGDGELRHKFCIISRPLGVSGLDAWPSEDKAEVLPSSGSKERFPLPLLGALILLGDNS